MRNLFILFFVLQFSTAQAALNICPRMPVATAVTNQFLTSINAAGQTTLAQPSFSNLSGNIATSQVNSGTNASSSTFYRGDNTWNAATTITAPMSSQVFTTGSGTYNKDYTFVITSGSATVGATYTNNSVTFTVHATVSSATQVVMSGNGAPASSGTLTKATGTGDATLTFSQFLAPIALKVTVVGGGGAGGGSATGTGSSNGGGGGGGGTAFATFINPAATYAYAVGGGGAGASNASGGSGTSSTFNSTVTGGGGTGGNAGGVSTGIGIPASTAGAGGTGSGGDINIAGSSGQPGIKQDTTNSVSGAGGGSYLGGGALSRSNSSGTGTAGGNYGGGGSGGCMVSSGAASTGGAGATGIVIVEEYYQ